MSKNDFIMKPKVDYCFKELMGDETVRTGFLSALLRIKPEDIAESLIMNIRRMNSYGGPDS